MCDVSVVLSTCNRAAMLEQTLACLARLEVAAISWELLVVDNGSVDATPRVLADVADRLPLRALVEPRPGKNCALNLALPLVRGELVVFTDDDVVPGVRWLSELVDAARRWPDDDIFAGRIVPIFPPHAPRWLRTHLFATYAFSLFTPDQPEGPLDRSPFGPNYAIRARTLAAIRFAEHFGPGGGTGLGDETELAQRLMQAGHRVIFVPAAEVGHVVRDEQLERPWLFRRARSHGRTYVQLAHLFSTSMQPRAWMRWQMLMHGVLYFMFVPLGGRRAFEYGAVYHYWRGALYEWRRRTHPEGALPLVAGRRHDR